jgi:Family of unknown function (DUF5856)
MATFVEFISNLHTSKQQSIVFHHQTDEYSVHKAMNNYYDEILERIDGLVESVSGVYGRPEDYSVHELVNYKDVAQVQDYFKKLYAYVESERKNIYQESWIQNQIDNIAELVGETCYLLTLK